MKNWKEFVAVLFIIGIVIAFITCDNGDDKTHTHQWQWVVTTPATATAEGLETETCATCGATNGTRPIEQTEPAVKEFPNIALFETYTATIQDARTACGSTDLEHVKVGEGEDAKDIVTIIKEAIVGAFNDAPSGPAGAGHKNMFRTVFGTYGGVTIIVDNPATAYKVKAPNGNTIYFHINHLNSLSAADLQTAITAAVRAMDPTGPSLPYEAE
jgi:hypothetical protein